MLCTLCKNSAVQQCKAQISAILFQLCTLCTAFVMQSLQKVTVFCALQLCTLCTPLKGGLGPLQRPIIPLGGTAPDPIMKDVLDHLAMVAVADGFRGPVFDHQPGSA